jgi:hypothetical protein
MIIVGNKYCRNSLYYNRTVSGAMAAAGGASGALGALLQQ